MGLLPKVLKGFDRDPEAVPLNYQSIEQFRSKTGGTISLCFMICAVIIFAIKILDLTQRNHVSVTSQISKNRFNEAINVTDGDFRLTLSVVIDNKKIYIKQNELLEYGINLTVHRIWFEVKDGVVQPVKQNMSQLVPCQDSLVIEEQFCLPIVKDWYSLVGRVDIDQKNFQNGTIYQRYALRVQPCQKQVNSQCQNITNNMYYYFIFQNTIFDMTIANESEIVMLNSQIRFFQQHPPFRLQSHIGKIFYFKKLLVFTNPSIFPDFYRMLFGHHQNYTQYAAQNYEKTVDTWFYDEEVQTEEFPRVDSKTYDDENSCLLALYLKRSIYTHTYIREYDKLDSMLGQFFGLIALLSIIMFTLYRGYNSWSFKQFRKKVRGQSYQHPTLCNYYMHLFKSLYSFCCCKKKTETESPILIEELEQKEELNFYGLWEKVNASQKQPCEQKTVHLMLESCENITVYPQTGDPHKQSLLINN